MSSNNPTSGTTSGTGTSTTNSAGTTGGSASGGVAPDLKGNTVQSAAPSDAPPDAAQSGTPDFAAPGSLKINASQVSKVPANQLPGESFANLGTPAENAPQATQTPASTGYPLRLTVDGHTHAGTTYKKGQTIALDAAEYRWAISNKIGEAGKRDDVGLDVDEQGNTIKPVTAEEIPLPESEAITPDNDSNEETGGKTETAK
jgi:hypothetical protein